MSSDKMGEVSSKPGSKEETSHGKQKSREDGPVRLLCWNIYGLESENLRERTQAVCNIINGKKPDVVFLQEVIFQTLLMLRGECSEYLVLSAAEVNYFTAILLRKDTVELIEENVYAFPKSRMSRKLQTAKCQVRGVPCVMMTSHLESLDPHSAERKNQLKISLDAMVNSDPKFTTIFGGDLNLRDEELVDISGLPEGIHDIWQLTGSKSDCKYTWGYYQGAQEHDKPKSNSQFRLDRIYLRQNEASKLWPTEFHLIGKERIPKSNDFPSDHWGIMMSFHIKR